jgi:hypothetical protein
MSMSIFSVLMCISTNTILDFLMAMDLSMSTGALQYDLWVSFAVKVSGFN